MVNFGPALALCHAREDILSLRIVLPGFRALGEAGVVILIVLGWRHECNRRGIRAHFEREDESGNGNPGITIDFVESFQQSAKFSFLVALEMEDAHDPKGLFP